MPSYVSPGKNLTSPTRLSENQMATELTPFDLTALNEPGYEVWSREAISECTDRKLPYLLIVLYEKGENPLKILDPQKKHEEILAADNYLEIVDYLREEDYSRLERCLRVDDEDDEDDD